MIDVFERRLEGLKYELPTDSSSLASFVLNKEKETQFIQNQLATLRTIGEVPKFDIGPTEPSSKVSPGFGATPIRNWPTPFYFGGVTTPNPSVFFPDQTPQTSKPFDIAQVLREYLKNKQKQKEEEIAKQKAQEAEEKAEAERKKSKTSSTRSRHFINVFRAY